MKGKLIRKVEVEGFRGVKSATLADTAGINILVGKSGKSSILEAIYVALFPAQGLRYVVERHRLIDVGALFYNRSGMARIRLAFSDGTSREVEIIHRQLYGKREKLEVRVDGRVENVVVQVSRGGRPTVAIGGGGEGASNVSFITYNMVDALGTAEEVYSTLVSRGGPSAKSAVVEALKAEYEALRDIEVLVAHDVPILYFVFKDMSIPYYVASDGLRYASLILMSLFAREGGTIIIEEPEVRIHPNLIDVIIDAIVRAYREGRNQLFISTHSFDLLYHLPLKARDELGSEELKVYRIHNDGGIVKTLAYSLSEALETVADLELDIRR